MMKKQYIFPTAECLPLQTGSAFMVLVASAGAAGDAGLIIDNGDDSSYDFEF